MIAILSALLLAVPFAFLGPDPASILGYPSILPYFSASLASTRARFVGEDVFRSVLMPLRAMSFDCIVPPTMTSLNILSMRNLFEMERLAARFHSAQMVDFKTVFERAYPLSVRYPVSLEGFSLDANSSVTIRANASLPNPAWGSHVLILNDGDLPLDNLTKGFTHTILHTELSCPGMYSLHVRGCQA